MEEHGLEIREGRAELRGVEWVGRRGQGEAGGPQTLHPQTEATSYLVLTSTVPLVFPGCIFPFSIWSYLLVSFWVYHLYQLISVTYDFISYFLPLLFYFYIFIMWSIYFSIPFYFLSISIYHLSTISHLSSINHLSIIYFSIIYQTIYFSLLIHLHSVFIILSFLLHV